jgi:type II secretory pathway pseudopilin PulG
MHHFLNMNPKDDRSHHRLATKLHGAFPPGFSVVEVLVIIIVVGVITFVALPYAGFNGKPAREAQERRVAQSIVSVYQSGFAAGVAWKGSTRNAKIDAVTSGQAPAEGAFSGKFFKVPGGMQRDMAGASKYIGCDANGDLYYDKSGGQPSL